MADGGSSGAEKAKPREDKAEAALPDMAAALNGGRGLPKKIPARRQIKYGIGFRDVATTKEIKAAASAGDVRLDLGHPIDLRVPIGYYDQIKQVLTFFETDPLFRYLVSRFWEYGNNRFDWVVSGAPKDDAKNERAQKEQRFWNHWAASINETTNHLLPGVDNINMGMFKSLPLCGMAPMHWSWSYVDFEGDKYWAPVVMKLEHPMSIVIASAKKFGNYVVFLRKQAVETGKLDTNSEAETGGVVAQLRKNKDYQELRTTNSFVLRYEYANVDARMNRTGGGSWMTAQIGGVGDRSAAYPSVPYICLQEAMQLRRGLAAADLRLIDGIINYLMVWKVGNSDTDADGNLINAPRAERKDAGGTIIEKSTLSQVEDWLSDAEQASVLEIALPYWITVETHTPDTEALLNHEKYLHATSEILHRFGVFVGEQSTDPQLTEVNITNFESQIENIRQNHIARFWEMIAKRVMDHPRNAGKFESGAPNYQWRSLATRLAEWRSEIAAIAKIGRISNETLWRAMSISPAAEEARIRKENESGQTEECNDHTPVGFVQSTVDPDGGSTRTSDGGNLDRGRPKKMPGDRKDKAD